MKGLLNSLAGLLLAACVAPNSGCAHMPGIGQYCLQPTTSAPAFAVRQQVSASFRDQREMLIADIENQADALNFVGLTPFGLTVFQVNYDNRTAHAVRLPDSRLSPELMLGMLQLALWPADAVQRGLGNGAEVQDSPGVRRIVVNSQPVMELHHDDSPPPFRRMRIDWPALDMTLDIRALAEQDSP